ncbi:hypothetical protein BaRGS_00032759 [Batillaria attramentaria]|uniref:Uncharacterized protein n=1 Tax=Batillaria attramentaria TaxID=370345 RepID=A0ABD0JM21_9CAEN
MKTVPTRSQFSLQTRTGSHSASHCVQRGRLRGKVTASPGRREWRRSEGCRSKGTDRMTEQRRADTSRPDCLFSEHTYLKDPRPKWNVTCVTVSGLLHLKCLSS